jgi:hypothetical protein
MVVDVNRAVISYYNSFAKACTGTGDVFLKEMVDILRSYAR